MAIGCYGILCYFSLLQNAILKICRSIEWQCVMRKQHEHPSDVPKQLVIWRILLGEHEKNEKNMCSIAWCDQGRWNKYSSINAMAAMVSDFTNPLKSVKVASSPVPCSTSILPVQESIFVSKDQYLSWRVMVDDIHVHSREILVNARLKCTMIPRSSIISSSGWRFQTCFIFHFIYGMSFFPLTNSIIFQDGFLTTNQSCFLSVIRRHSFGDLWRVWTKIRRIHRNWTLLSGLNLGSL